MPFRNLKGSVMSHSSTVEMKQAEYEKGKPPQQTTIPSQRLSVLKFQNEPSKTK